MMCATSEDTMNEDILYEETNKEIVEGVVIRAATLDQIIDKTIKSFGDEDKEPTREGAAMLRIFFLMHQWLLDSQILANYYFMRLEAEPQSENAWKICCVLRFWMRTFPTHFDGDKSLTSMMEQFSKKLLEWDRGDLQTVLDVTDVPSYDWMRVVSVRRPVNSGTGRKEGSESLVFHKLESEDLATQLTVLEFKAFRRITFSDLKKYAITGSLKDSPRLEKSISLFNGLCQWIQCLILNKTTPAERATVIARFVEVARQLHKQNNYNTLMAVVGGLSHSSIARLNKTNACLSQETQKTLSDFTELLSSSNNFSNYRREVNQAIGFKIPILGIHLKDLILLHTALPDYIGEHLVNFRKLCQLSHTFAFIVRCQLCNLPYDENPDLCNTLRLSLDYHYTEEEIYELSLAREPRNSVSPSTPTKPVVFADWVAGLRPPDPETLKKHVNDMVEAVFKVYDHDKDGSISQEEFDQIAENFPFIDSFSVLDADNDGSISRHEMKNYFMRANCHALRNSFKHDFHETTYFKPTFCSHCTGLLWGIIKQGWKCRICAINAHKHCRDLVVAECRSSRHSSTPRMGSVSESSSVSSLSVAGSSSDIDDRRRHSMRLKRSLCRTVSTQTDSPEEMTAAAAARVLEGVLSEAQTSAEDESVVQGSARTPELSRNVDKIAGRVHLKPPLADVSEFDEVDEHEENDLEISQDLNAQMQKALSEKETLAEENRQLREKIESQEAQINAMRNHIGTIRQHTISFILSQMDTLNIQRDSEV